MGNRKNIIIIALLVAVAGTSLFLLRGRIKATVYSREVDRLVEAIPPELSEKYGEELEYTMDKFWDCYSDGIVSQNDMTDIMDRSRELRSQAEIKDLDVFRFIGYVSRCYTDGMNRRHREQTDEFEGPEVIEQ